MAEGGKDTYDNMVGLKKFPETEPGEFPDIDSEHAGGSEECFETSFGIISSGHSFDKTVSDDLSSEKFKQIYEEYEQVYKNGGMEELQKYLRQKLNSWKTTAVNIAVIGRSGVGKSTFINAIRNLKADDKGAAGTDVVEATKSVKHYSFEERSNIMLWDLPGIGTRSFKREGYEQKLNILIKELNVNSLNGLEGFDFYLLLTADRFTEDDVWLANKIVKRFKKKYYLVRTKVAIDISNEQTSRNKPRKKETILKVIKTSLKCNLDEENLVGVAVYLIDSLSPLDFDFEMLKSQLIADAPDSKIEAVAFSLSCHSKHIIERKKQVLLGLHLVTTSFNADVFFEDNMDHGTLHDELALYREQFKLTDSDMKCVSDSLGISAEELISKLDLRSVKYYDKYELLNAYQTNFGRVSKHWYTLSMMSSEILIGLIPSIFYHWRKMYVFLKQLLNMCVDDAIKIQEEVCKLVANDAKRV